MRLMRIMNFLRGFFIQQRPWKNWRWVIFFNYSIYHIKYKKMIRRWVSFVFCFFFLSCTNLVFSDKHCLCKNRLISKYDQEQGNLFQFVPQRDWLNEKNINFFYNIKSKSMNYLIGKINCHFYHLINILFRF